MDRQLLKDTIGWGSILWLIGFGLARRAVSIVPTSAIGWIILPIGTALTLWVLWRRVKADTFQRYLMVAIAWTGIAVAFDYVFIVRVLQPTDGYYKLDVYLYYGLTFVLPLIAWWVKKDMGPGEIRTIEPSAR